jgi:hypothetical protein
MESTGRSPGADGQECRQRQETESHSDLAANVRVESLAPAKRVVAEVASLLRDDVEFAHVVTP